MSCLRRCSTDFPSKLQAVLCPLTTVHWLQKQRGSPCMNLKTFPSKWPKQMAFHFGARSGTSWRSPSFPLHELAHQAQQAHTGLLWTGNWASPTGLLPAHLLPVLVPVGHWAGGGSHSWQNAVMLSPYPLSPASLQLFGWVSEAAQTCWAGLISSASLLHIAQKRHFCAVPH